MNLRETLSALGLPAPSAEPAAPAATPADEINEVCRAWFGHETDIVNLDLMVEAHHALTMWIGRLEWALARHGAKVTQTAEPTMIKVKTNVMGVDRLRAERCDHLLVDVDNEKSCLECRTCKAHINPMWWLGRHTKDVERAEGWRRALEGDRRKLQLEIDELKKERAKHSAAVRRRTKRS